MARVLQSTAALIEYTHGIFALSTARGIECEASILLSCKGQASIHSDIANRCSPPKPAGYNAV